MSSPANEIILEVRNISKSFLIHKKQIENFKETVAGFFRSHSAKSELFYALRNISFELRQGEVLGIIGENGAGKSTLLKILSGIMQPDEGEINFYGKSASILDVGAGFHPELTGRENIFLTGSLYGVSKADTQKEFNDILAFSGIDNFIDEPVKNYSAGMYLRLAFSIVAHIDAEILLLDEVMGVGDAEFQLKCQNKIKGLINQNKTVIIVSHNLVELSKYAQRIIRLEEGKILEDSESSSIIEKYLEEAYIRSKGKTKDGILTTIQPPYFLDDNILSNDFIQVNEIRVVAEGKNHDDEFMRDDKVLVNISLENKTEFSIQCGIFTGDLSGSTSLTVISSDSEGENLKTNYVGKMEYSCYFPAYFFNSGLINFRFFFVLMSPDNDLAKAKRFTVSRNIVVKVLRVQTEENIFDNIPGLYRPSFHWTQKLLP